MKKHTKDLCLGDVIEFSIDNMLYAIDNTPYNKLIATIIEVPQKSRKIYRIRTIEWNEIQTYHSDVNIFNVIASL